MSFIPDVQLVWIVELPVKVIRSATICVQAPPVDELPVKSIAEAGMYKVPCNVDSELPRT